MANEQNLIPIQEVNSRRTREQHSEDSRKGGKKSGEVRRQRKAMKEQAELLLSLPFNLKDNNGRELSNFLRELGIDEENIDNQMAMLISLWKTALGNGKNQVTAFQELRKVVQDEHSTNNEDRVQIIDDLPEEDGDDEDED